MTQALPQRTPPLLLVHLITNSAITAASISSILNHTLSTTSHLTMKASFERRSGRRKQRRWWMKWVIFMVAMGAVRVLITSYSAAQQATELAQYSSVRSSATADAELIQTRDDARIQRHGIRDPKQHATKTADVPRIFGNTPGKDWPKIIDDFVKLYRQSAAPSIHIHTQSWNRIIATDMDVRTDDEVAMQQEGDRMFERFPYLHQLSDYAEMMARNVTKRDLPMEPVIWDKEESINRYFQIINERCSRSIHAVKDSNFMHQCWGTIIELIEGPRCTVRLDSRYVCNGPPDGKRSEKIPLDIADDWVGTNEAESTAPPAEPVRQYTVEQVIQQHFTDDTLNIVIIGAGPVGLQLANILNHLKTRDSIRILMFEKRVDHPGRKKEYSRDWCTHISFDAFRRGDPRVVEFFDQIIVRDDEKPRKNNATKVRNYDEEFDIFHDSARRKVNLPLMMIETLLLISNRNLGVKFIYENIKTHRHLLGQVPNLVVFDASGHRLEKMERTGKTAASSTSSFFDRMPSFSSESQSVTVSDWSPDLSVVDKAQRYPWFFMEKKDYPVLRDRNFLAKVATQTTAQGTIMYPVTPQGHSFRLRTMEFVNFRYSRRVRGMFDGWQNHMRDVMQSDHPLCGEDVCGIVEDFLCDDYCALAFGWDSSIGYRPDIFEAIKTTWPYVSTMSAMIALTADQFDLMAYIYHELNSKAEPVRGLPLTFMVTKEAFKKNNMAYTVVFFASHSGMTHPVSSLYTFTPYIYNDVVVPMSATTDGRIGGAPLLRVGDSLSSGNSNLGSGLSQHLGIMETFGRKLKDFEI